MLQIRSNVLLININFSMLYTCIISICHYKNYIFFRCNLDTQSNLHLFSFHNALSLYFDALSNIYIITNLVSIILSGF